jgi:arylsulfatase A-like enzyme
VHRANKYEEIPAPETKEGKRALQSTLSEDLVTLAEVMKEGGYQTAGFVGARFLRSQYGFAQGFDHYDTSFSDNTVLGAVVNDAMSEWLAQSRDPSKPLFLYLHYMDVHGPYNAAPEFMDPLIEQVEALPEKQRLTREEFAAIHGYLKKPPREATDPWRFERLKDYREYWVARYEAGVKEMDHYIAQLRERLTEAGIWDDAYVILLADHGEALCEHGIWEHGYSMYQTDLHVPLILRWPNVLPAGKRVPQLVSLIDLMPTVLEQVQLPAPPGMQGVSLVAHITDTLPKRPLVRFAEAIRAGPEQYVLVQDYSKLVTMAVPTQQRLDGTTAPVETRYQLFNLRDDPGEQQDMSTRNPAVVNHLGELMAKTVQTNMRIRPDEAAPRAPVDAESMKILAALGYVGSTDEEDDSEDVEAETQPAGDAEDESGDRGP